MSAPRYCQINDAREILRDVAQVHRFIHLQLSDKEENALAPIVTWQNEPDRGYTTVDGLHLGPRAALQQHHRLPDRRRLQHPERGNPDPLRRHYP